MIQKYFYKYSDNFFNIKSVRVVYVLVLMMLCSVSGVNAQEDAYREYIKTYKGIAVKHQKKYGIPASITLAQGLLESDAGRSRLARKANNHFGIKCGNDWRGRKIKHNDDKKRECFRRYKRAKHSYEDHAKFLMKQRYAPLFRLDITDYKGWAKTLKRCGYATDPNYPEKLIKIIEKYELYKYDKPGRKKK